MRYLKDPLVIFLLFGLLVFFAERYFIDSDSADYRIDISHGLQARILDQWQAQMGRPPTEAEATGLQDQWIRE